MFRWMPSPGGFALRARIDAHRWSFVAVVVTSLLVIALSGAYVAHQFGFWPTQAAKPVNAGIVPIDPNAAAEAGLNDHVKGVVDQPTPTPVPDPTLAAAPTKPGASVWIPILMYHYVRVAPAGDTAGFNLSVTPADFAAQMQYLAGNGYTTLTMRDVDLILLGQKGLPAKPIALTFDDGYEDFYTAAAPTLRQNHLTATNFIPTQLVGGSNAAYMSWGQIQELDRQGFEMAAHSQFHVDVSKVNAARARIEISGSKADLESHLGHPVYDWAYPYGGFSAATVAMVHDAGFVSGVTTQYGTIHTAAQLLTLSRVRVAGGESLAAYEAAVRH